MSSIAAPDCAPWDSNSQRDSAGQAIRAHIFVSHFHWDHIQGIPVLLPAL